MWCIFLGFTELLWGQVVLCIPKFTIPKVFRLGREGVSIHQDSGTMGKVLWVRSLSRLQYQVSGFVGIARWVFTPFPYYTFLLMVFVNPHLLLQCDKGLS